MHSFKSTLGSLLLLLFLAAACKNDSETNPEDRMTPPASSETSENALDWNGQYKGTLPCADCEGIATTLTLKADGSFQRVMYYRGKSDTAIVDRGEFNWDSSGSRITLALEGGEAQSYKVGENQLWHLDQNGETINGDLADKYILTKNLIDYQLENKTWVLKELMGQAIITKEGDTEAYLQFNAENAMITGSNGCNRISMGYELLEGKRLKIAPGISTLMACPDDSISDAFNEVLQRADNYTVSDGELHLNKARMAPMAKFIEQELKE